MKGSRLNLVIRANSVELHDNSATHDSVVKSVKIQKGDVETALKECYIFLNEKKIYEPILTYQSQMNT